MSTLSPIEDIIAEAKAGRMVILVDDEDRENEGDLVIPAEFADAQAVNFMAKHARGLICLALEKTQVERLGLPPMARHNASRHATAFTVSIEAREGVTTGISAGDRARTIAAACNPQAHASDIGSPGHIFPLEAREGGVLVRAGHTEAAVDIARLAGLKPSGVICEIMNDDGTMARLPDLLEFAALHGLKIGTIADLIAYRRRSEKLVTRLVESTITTSFAGSFQCIAYAQSPGYAEHLALVKNSIPREGACLVRMHALDVLHDVLGDSSHGRAGVLQQAMRMLDAQGSGVLVLLREPRRTAASDGLKLKRGEEPATPILRDYGIGAQILLDLGVREMTLLTNTPKMIVGLDGYGLHINGHRPIEVP
ncbi:MAG: 3,4-dihydroxy-2-butanone-4-phosphate synthase [Pseudomonadota bacterium]